MTNEVGMVLKRWGWTGLVFSLWAYGGEWFYTKIGIDMNQYNNVFIVHVGVGVWLAWKSSKQIFQITKSN